MLNCIAHSFAEMDGRMSRSGRFVSSAICCAVICTVGNATSLQAQTSPGTTTPQTCVALLADDPAPRGTPSPDTARSRLDTITSGIGGARAGAPDIILLASIQADEVRFATQPQARVRFCWAGDTLTVVRRDNLPRPVVAGTTYRNVFVAVELLGRLNAECLVDRIPMRTAVIRAPGDSANLGRCAFLGVSAAGGQQPGRPPSP
jgi:hypothetical protein